MPTLSRILALCFAAASVLSLSSANAQPVKPGNVAAELIAEHTSITPGKPSSVALRLNHDPHWHTYWKNSGDSGMPVSIRWRLPQGFAAGEIQWPFPRRIATGPLVSYGYEDEVLLLADIVAPTELDSSERVQLAARASWLECKDVCIPQAADLQLTLRVNAEAQRDSRWTSQFEKARAALPKPLPELELVARRTDQLIELTLRSAQLGVDGPREVYFFSEHEGVVESSGAQQLEKSNGRWRLLAPIANQASGNLSRLRGVLVADTAWPGSSARAVSVAAPVTQVAASELKPILSARGGSSSGANFTLLAALAFGFAGGVILNLMPCVLPVVSLKVLGFAQEREQARSAAWLFALGILVSFWMLAAVLVVFRAAGETLGWGFQLQTPAVVAALAMLFFALALNLSGVFEFAQLLPDRVLNSQFKHPHANAFFNGVLACVVATPCTAPFMGAALGFAATQSAVIGLAVFTAVAAGMAAPYVLLAHLPGLLKFLPKPGAWLTRFKQLLAFPLYASVVWLGWVLGQQAGVSGVIRLSAALVALALAVWFLSLWQKKSAAARWPALAALAGTLVIAGPLAWQDSSSANAGGARQAWEQYSKAKIETALQLGKPVFIDFTAAWCVTCQVNKRLVLETASVRKAFVERGVTLFRADWTKRDAEIEEALRQLGRNGVPVYVLLRTGREPLLLPELLRERYVMDALAALAPAVKQARVK